MSKFRAPNIKKKGLQSPKIKNRLQSAIDISEQEEDFIVSFSHFSMTGRGQTLEDAESKGMLSQVISAFCSLKRPVYKLESELGHRKFCNYGSFPKHSKFSCPPYITEDANWSRLHINGTYCVIGHIVRNVFYVVFLDAKHEFFPTKLKHT